MRSNSRPRFIHASCINIHLQDLVNNGFDVRTTVIVDNSPDAYQFDPDNAVPIGHYFATEGEVEVSPLLLSFFYILLTLLFQDSELIDLLPLLHSLLSVYDVRSVLSLRSMSM